MQGFRENENKSTLDNSPPPLLNLKLLRPQGQIIDVKFSKLSENCLLGTCITILSRINEKNFMLSRQQGQIIDVKCKKSQ